MLGVHARDFAKNPVKGQKQQQQRISFPVMTFGVQVWKTKKGEAFVTVNIDDCNCRGLAEGNKRLNRVEKNASSHSIRDDGQRFQ